MEMSPELKLVRPEPTEMRPERKLESPEAKLVRPERTETTPELKLERPEDKLARPERTEERPEEKLAGFEGGGGDYLGVKGRKCSGFKVLGIGKPRAMPPVGIGCPVGAWGERVPTKLFDLNGK